MKNYIIGSLLIIILILLSIIYKNGSIPRMQFPVSQMSELPGEKISLYLYIFFSKTNCPDCLEIIHVLNNLPPQFFVTGLVPRKELTNEMEIRRVTGATFPLKKAVLYSQYIPFYSPTIIGVSPSGEILFVLPGVPGEKEYLQKFLDALYVKVSPLFMKD